MGRSGPPPEPARELRPRAVYLDARDDAVFSAWCDARDERTLQEFCETEWVLMATRPAPPPAPPLYWPVLGESGYWRGKPMVNVQEFQHRRAGPCLCPACKGTRDLMRGMEL